MSEDHVVGVCCSGGGIRAASYALGCLQVLDEHDVLRGEHRARFISAVSGGSYAVGAMAIMQHGIEAAAKGNAVDPRLVADGPYAPSSPELTHLRDNLSYLTHGPGGLRAELWRAVMGILMNLVLFASCAMAAGYFGGWIYGWRFPQLRAGCDGVAVGGRPATCVTAIHPTGRVLGICAVLGALALIVGLGWVSRRWSATVIKWWQRAALWLALLAAVWVVLALATPQALAWMHRVSLPVRTDTTSAASRSVRNYWLPLGGLGGLFGALAGVVGPVWKALRSKSGTGEGSGFVGGLLTRFRAPLVNLLTTLAVPALFGGLLLIFMHNGSTHSLFVKGNSGWVALGFVAPVVVLVLISHYGDLNSWSLHTIYKARLGEAFDQQRCIAPPKREGGAGKLEVEPRHAPLPLADLKLEHFPEVLVCATANITSYGLVPTGTGAAPFLFSQSKVGGPAVGHLDTLTYETGGLRMRRSLTVMDAVSISGAAVSPEMGRMTRAPMRFLLALANVRLGVWVPKPSKVKTNEKRLALARAKGAPSDPARFIPQPSVRHLLNEALGRNPPNSRYVYVTDGGHYDNLGLVELLREDRQCEWIWCIDASGDHIDTFSTLGEALAIAQAELGVYVDIDPRVMAPTGSAPTFVSQPFCFGTITYPAKPGQEARTGTLVVVKTGVPSDAPWSVLAFHASNAKFPCDPTTNQLYNADRFNAYLALGRCAMTRAFDAMKYQYREFLANT